MKERQMGETLVCFDSHRRDPTERLYLVALQPTWLEVGDLRCGTGRCGTEREGRDTGKPLHSISTHINIALCVNGIQCDQRVINFVGQGILCEVS